jgi:riboflavin synthase
MFTGIVTAIGRIRSATPQGDLRVVVECEWDTLAIPLGASIACSGPCLTVVDRGPGWFALDVSAETVSRTAPGMWAAGRRLNLERALRVGDELGGHIVTGHVDGVGQVVEVTPEGASRRLTIEAPAALAPLIAPKGSIALDGVSLTVNAVEGSRFTVNIIPHTAAHTTLGDLGAGDLVNLEADVLARYLARMLEARA